MTQRREPSNARVESNGKFKPRVELSVRPGECGHPDCPCTGGYYHPPEPVIAPQPLDDESRCAICGWPLDATTEKGCARGNCSLRPRPENLYAPERAKRESLFRHTCGVESTCPACEDEAEDVAAPQGVGKLSPEPPDLGAIYRTIEKRLLAGTISETWPDIWQHLKKELEELCETISATSTRSGRTTATGADVQPAMPKIARPCSSVPNAADHTTNPKGVEGVGQTARELLAATGLEFKRSAEDWVRLLNQTLTLRAELQQAREALQRYADSDGGQCEGK